MSPYAPKATTKLIKSELFRRHSSEVGPSSNAPTQRGPRFQFGFRVSLISARRSQFDSSALTDRPAKPPPGQKIGLDHRLKRLLDRLHATKTRVGRFGFNSAYRAPLSPLGHRPGHRVERTAIRSLTASVTAKLWLMNT
jgi:hypothetical protein